MKQADCQKLIDPGKYQVFIFYCPAQLPLSFFTHSWFICNKKGNLSRWEVLGRVKKNNVWGHIRKNYFSLFQGTNILPLFIKSRLYWGVKILNKIESDTAEEIIDLIEISNYKYPYKKYCLWGPNSNTYTQWVLNHFPELNIKLPWSAIGKNSA